MSLALTYASMLGGLGTWLLFAWFPLWGKHPPKE